MSKDNTKAADVAKEPTKMDRCRPIFNELHAEGFVLPEGVKTLRALFISRSIAEVGMTKSGAATYWSGLVSQAAGGPLYPHPAKRKPKATVEPTPETPAGAESPEGEERSEDDLAHLAS